MNKNSKKIFLLTTVFMILLTISAISAEEVNEDTVIDDAQFSSQDIISDSVSDTITDSVDNKEIIKKDINNNMVTKGAATHIVTNDNVEEIFGGDGHTLSDSVNEGDTLDFQGLIDNDHSIIVSKPVNVISSTQDAVISLHSSGVSFDVVGDPGRGFVINGGASGSNVSGIYLNNTQFWVHSVKDVYISNMSMIVKDAPVGTGAGQTSIRFSDNVTLDNCHIYTENNGGTSSVVFAISKNCKLINSRIEGYGNVGNIVYALNFINCGDGAGEYEGMLLPQFMQLMNQGKLGNLTVINCTITTPNGGGICEPLYQVPPGSVIINNTLNATGGKVNSGINGTFINNTVINGIRIDGLNNAVMTGNVIDEGLVTISGSNVTFTDNTVNAQISVTGKNATITDNHVESSTNPAITLSGAATGATLSNNYVIANGATGDNAISIASGAASTATVSGNIPSAIHIITDDTYFDFFDPDGNILEGAILEDSEVRFNGGFFNRKFVIDVPIIATKGETEAAFYDCTFEFNSDVTAKDLIFTGTFDTPMITSSANTVFDNVLFDNIAATSQNVILPITGSNITIKNSEVTNIEAGSFVGSTNAGSINLNVINSKFEDNIATQTLLRPGAGTSASKWNITLQNSNFTRNNGGNGGVVQLATKANHVLTIDQCNFDSNTASGKAGVVYASSNNAVVSITNSNFTNNQVPPSTSGGSAISDLAGVLCVSNAYTDVTLSNNIMTGNTAQNGTDIYFEAMNKVITTDAKLIAEDATTDKDQFVDLKFKLTDDMGNIIGFKGGLFNYSVTLNDEIISYVDTLLYGRQYGFNGIANKTLNATYPGGNYSITPAITTGADKFSSIEIINGNLEVIGPPEPVILTDETWDQFFNDDGTLKEGTVAEGDELEFHGTFTNRNMNINIPITITTGEDQAVFDGCTFTINSPTAIKNVQFTGETSSHTITANANLTFENVTFDGVKATEAYMINPAVRANITFNNCTISNFEGNAIVRPSAKRAGISITAIDSVFKDNNAAFSLLCEFGNSWNINLTNSNFTNNNGQNGAIVQGMSTGTTLKLYVDNCNFEENIASGKAGIIYSASNNAIISITNSNFTNNQVSSSDSGGSSTTNLASTITLGTGNTDLTLTNNIITGSTAENGTDIYFDITTAGTGKIFTDAKLIAEDATTDKDQFVDLKFKLTDDMGNLIGFKSGTVFNYSVTLNDEIISYVDTLLYGRIYGFNGIANKTLNATYPGGNYSITPAITTGADKFDSIEIINGNLEVIAPNPQPTITYEVLNDVEGKVAIEFTVFDEEENEISPAPLVLSGDITGTTNTNKVYKNADLTAGEYVFNVKFEETDDYQESSIDITLTVQKDPQTIIDELNQSLINNQTALNNNITALEELQEQNAALQEQITTLEEALEANKTALNNNITALEEANEQIAQLEQNIETLNQQLTDNQTALAGNITALEEAQEEIETLNGQITALEEALEANETALAQAEQEKAALNEQITDLENALEANQTALAQAEEENEELSAQITALEEALEANETALAQAEQEKAALNEQITALEEALEANQTALAQAEEENEELSAQITALEEALAEAQGDLADAEEEIEALNSQITTLEEELSEAQDELADAEEEIETLNSQITTLEEELSEAQDELADAEEEIETLNSQIETLENNLNTTLDALAEAQDELADAEEEIEALNSQITDLEEALEQKESELEESQEALEEANEEIDELKYKVSELELALQLTENALNNVIDALEELNQPKTTSISIDPLTDVKYGDEITISGLLVNEDATGLANQDVTITFNGQETTVPTRNGEFTYTTTATTPGENTITASYAGSDKYLGSDAEYTFEVAKANTYINLTDIEAVKKGETAAIGGILYDHNGNALANKVVRLLVNNGRKTVKTNDMGEFSFDYTTTKVGEMTLTATFEGNDLYEATTTETAFEVKALSTVITIDPMDTIIKGTQATITGTLTDENGNAIANAQIKLTINGSPKTLKTDSEGKFTHTYTMGKVGENTIAATYAGSTNYEAAECETTVEVAKAQPVITIDPIESVTKGESATITGTLTDADGNAIANAQVKVTINGSPKTLKTDANGAFTHTFKMTKEGTNNITAAFNGNNDFEAIEATSTVEVIKAE